MNELDARLAKIRQRKKETRGAITDDLARLTEGLTKARSEFVILEASRETLAKAIQAESRRIAGLRRRVTVGVVLLALVALLVLAMAGGIANRMLDVARTGATDIRAKMPSKSPRRWPKAKPPCKPFHSG